MAWDGTQGTCGVVVRRWRYALLGTLLHTHTLTHTDIGHDTVWYVHTVERGLSVAGTQWSVGRAVVHMDARCGSFQWLEHGLYARHTDTQTDCFKAHVDSIYL